MQNKLLILVREWTIPWNLPSSDFSLENALEAAEQAEEHAANKPPKEEEPDYPKEVSPSCYKSDLGYNYLGLFVLIVHQLCLFNLLHLWTKLFCQSRHRRRLVSYKDLIIGRVVCYFKIMHASKLTSPESHYRPEISITAWVERVLVFTDGWYQTRWSQISAKFDNFSLNKSHSMLPTSLCLPFWLKNTQGIHILCMLLTSPACHQLSVSASLTRWWAKTDESG